MRLVPLLGTPSVHGSHLRPLIRQLAQGFGMAGGESSEPISLQARYGGKGSGLIYLSYLGVPTRDGFIIPSDVARSGLHRDRPRELEAKVGEHIALLEADIRREDGQVVRLGDPSRPLLLAVRGGAPASGEAAPGVPWLLINSISAETERYDAVLPLVKKHNAAVVALCMGDQAMPDTAQARADLAGLAARLRAAGEVMENEHLVRLRAPEVELVVFADGRREAFDDVVLACHSDQSLALLADPSPSERQILSAIPYQANRVFLHRDAGLMPQARRVWSSWNYLSEPAGDASRAVSVTYWMNSLQCLPTRRDYFVSLNPLREPRAETVVAHYEYHHPVFDAAALAAQKQLQRLSAHSGRARRSAPSRRSGRGWRCRASTESGGRSSCRRRRPGCSSGSRHRDRRDPDAARSPAPPPSRGRDG